MDFLNVIFLKLFTLIYPLVYNHFVAYIQFFIILAFLAWRTFVLIKEQGGAKSWGQRFWKLLLILTELFLVLFMAWFIILHFQTFASMQPGMTRLPVPDHVPTQEVPAAPVSLPPSER